MAADVDNCSDDFDLELDLQAMGNDAAGAPSSSIPPPTGTENEAVGDNNGQYPTVAGATHINGDGDRNVNSISGGGSSSRAWCRGGSISHTSSSAPEVYTEVCNGVVFEEELHCDDDKMEEEAQSEEQEEEREEEGDEEERGWNRWEEEEEEGGAASDDEEMEREHDDLKMLLGYGSNGDDENEGGDGDKDSKDSKDSESSVDSRGSYMDTAHMHTAHTPPHAPAHAHPCDVDYSPNLRPSDYTTRSGSGSESTCPATPATCTRTGRLTDLHIDTDTNTCGLLTFLTEHDHDRETPFYVRNFEPWSPGSRPAEGEPKRQEGKGGGEGRGRVMEGQ
jgi:hypothetical protein